VHLVSARDALRWRGLFSDLHVTGLRSHFGRGLQDVDERLLAAQALELLCA
jgi:hypothetical protein